LSIDYGVLIDELAVAAREAGEAILQIVRRGFEVESKQDTSPVTAADRAAELVILAALARAVASPSPEAAPVTTAATPLMSM
jgi:3'(2'), 5'-bisphosphate nucleotidase